MILHNKKTRSNRITGIILAGGKSSRMGEDKATKLHFGIPFILHVIKALESFTSQIIIVSDDNTHTQFGYPCIPDIIPNKGPIGGIYTGLKKSNTDKNIVLTCDIPFVIPKVIDHLINHYEASYEAVLYESSPLIGIYHKSIEDKILNNIEKGTLSIRKNIASLNAKYIIEEKNMIPHMQNINTPQHYKKAIQCN